MVLANAILNEAKNWGHSYARTMSAVLWWWLKVCLTLEIAIYLGGCGHYERLITPDEWLALTDSVMRWVTAGTS